MIQGGLLPKVVCILTGLYYTTFGALLFFSPHTFWSRIATIGQFNEHYARDVGSFLLPLGVLLLAAISDPAQFRLILVFAAAASALHAVSHLADGIRSTRDFVSTACLAAVAVLLAAIVPRQARGRK
jgi:hypothetical protein